MTFKQSKLAFGVAAAALTIAAAPQAMASSKDDATARKTEALEMQMQQMAEQMQAMQAELNRVKTSSSKSATETAKLQELDQWMAATKAAPAESHSKDNLVAVRGGWSKLDLARGSDANAGVVNGALTDGALLSNNNNADGVYFGGAFDFNVNNDLFGLMDGTSFAVEIGVEYSQYGQGDNTVSQTYGPLAVGGLGQTVENRATDARLRINASPKIRFMHGSKLRPWIIPVGMDINIIGVPSNAVSVLNAGMNFGAGVDYEVWRGIVIGADTRYHYSTSDLDGTPTDGFNAGGYVGFKF